MTLLNSFRAGAALALAALAAAGCNRGSGGEAATAASPVAVTVVHVGAAAGEALVLPARVSARDEVTLTARLAARLTSLPLREGDPFRAGQALAEFNAAETRSGLESGRAGLAAATLARDIARRQEVRLDSLYAARVATLHELEGAQAERRAAEAAWAQARAQLDQMESGVRITAPFDGVVVRRHADPGTTLGPGQPVLDIRSAAVGEITAAVPESELARLASGRAEYQVGDGPWQPATVARVDGMTDFATRSRVARLRPAAGTHLEAGAFARVRLAAAAGASSAGTGSAPAVPATAVIVRGGLTGVFVVEDGVARLRWLRVGRRVGGVVEVLAGLASDDAVIVSPAGLVDGRSVRIGS
jgi:RND family efflux transporter MFP subunit